MLLGSQNSKRVNSTKKGNFINKNARGKNNPRHKTASCYFGEEVGGGRVWSGQLLEGRRILEVSAVWTCIHP